MVSLCPLIPFYLPQPLVVMFFSYGFIISSAPSSDLSPVRCCRSSFPIIVFIDKVTLVQTRAEEHTVDGNVYRLPSEADLACLGLFCATVPVFP